MAKATSVRSYSGDRSETKRRVAEAAIDCLKARGFAGTSAREIGRAGGFSQALVFYHFDSVVDAMLAGLDLTGERRMEAYREALEGADGLGALLAVAGRVYREDLEQGHVTVLAEMIAGASSIPGLGAEIVSRLEPWIVLTEDALERVLAGSPIAGVLPSRDLASAIVALYLGLELLTHLDGDRARADSLFATAARLVSLLEPLGLTGKT
jgi:AcrR family transcriptional regulator